MLVLRDFKKNDVRHFEKQNTCLFVCFATHSVNALEKQEAPYSCLWFLWVLWLLAFPFVFHVMVPAIGLYWIFCLSI
jgi:hypothetical protein